MNDIIGRLASSLGRRDEEANLKLALEVCDGGDQSSVSQLIDLLCHKNKNIRSDALKVLYEIGEKKPALIEMHATVFLDLLQSTDNRMVWGAMTALDTITRQQSSFIHRNLQTIIEAADKGSVITKDHVVGILIKLAGNSDYVSDALGLLLAQMQACATNQLPMYAENALPVINQDFRGQFIQLLLSRMPEIEKESKRLRVAKVLKKLGK
jgi:hypothetical protein